MNDGKKHRCTSIRLGYKSWRKKSIAQNCLYVLAAFALVIPINIFQRTHAISDLTPPTLISGVVTTGSTMDTVNTTDYGYNQSLATIVTSDDLSLTSAPLLVYTSPSGKQTATGGSNGIEGNTVWQSIVHFPQYSESGLWVPTLYLEDFSGNKVTYSDAQMQAMGVNLDITLTGQGDTTDPVLASLTRTNPGVLDVTSSSPPADFVLHITDNISGIGIPTLTYTSPSGNQATLPVSCNMREGYTSTAADYDCTINFPQYGENGTWTPDLIIADGAGNTVHLTDADLQARGIDARVTLTGTSDTTPPVISDLNLTFANPPADNIPYGGAVLTLTGTISDNLSGLYGTSNISYSSPTGKIVYSSITLTGDTNGVFTTNVYLPQYTEGGTWEPTVFVQDVAGNQHTYTSSELESMGMNLAINVSKNVTETAAPGATVTSDYEGDGATEANPIEASVTTPSGGPVSIVIVQSSNVSDPTNGYTFFGRQVNITAPSETADNPLTLSFSIDSSVVPAGESASTLQITRNGTIVPDCTDQINASPNPCIFSRQTLVDGDILVKIHSTSASAWASGFPTHTNNYDFVGFTGTTKDYPRVNKVQANQIVSVDMKVKGVPNDTVDILASGEPTSQQVNCTDLTPIGSAVAALSAKNKGVERIGKNKFEYNWRTDKSWRNTCRIFSAQLKDGSSKKALFKFQ